MFIRFCLLLLLLLVLLLNACEAEGSSSNYACGHSAISKTKKIMIPPRVISNTDRNTHPDIFANDTFFLVENSNEFRPIRIGVSTADLEDETRYCTYAGQMVPNFLGEYVMCTEENVLTKRKKELLISDLLPSAIGLHQERLQVNDVFDTLIIPNFVVPDDISNPCRFYTIPSSHHVTGVRNVDFILYVSAVPSPFPEVVAWATSCAVLESGRPVVGIANIVPENIIEGHNIARVLAHEIGHALGFQIAQFDLANMVSNFSNVRGKPWSLEIISPKVLAAGAAHFNYPGIKGVELEDAGGEGTAYSHWKRRNLKNELMAGVVSNTGYYTAFTLAAFEDLGFYKADYSKAELMPWGYKAGSKFLEGKCAENGTSNFPDMFCTTLNGEHSCTNDRLGMGPCSVTLVFPFGSLPSYFRYFNNPRLGGSAPLMDYCPIIYPLEADSCINGNSTMLEGSLISENSRCLGSDGLELMNRGTTRAICASVVCNGTSSEGTYQVKFYGSSEYVVCPEGTEIEPHLYSTAFLSGTVICPSYVSVCSNPEAFVISGNNLSEKDARSNKRLKKKMIQLLYLCTLLAGVLSYF